MADEIKVELWEPETPANKYDAHVRALITADEGRSDEQIEEGFHYSVVVTFPNEQENAKGEKKDALAKYTRYFQDSAKAHDKTARVVEQIDQNDGTTNFRFIVVDKILRPRGTKPEAVEPDESDVPKAVKAA